MSKIIPVTQPELIVISSTTFGLVGLILSALIYETSGLVNHILTTCLIICFFGFTWFEIKLFRKQKELQIKNKHLYLNGQAWAFSAITLIEWRPKNLRISWRDQRGKRAGGATLSKVTFEEDVAFIQDWAKKQDIPVIIQ